MMAPEPLRSAMAAVSVEDTSLAIHSDKSRSRQQRVLDQVTTIQRSKSKKLHSGSASPSPTNVTMHPLQTRSAEFGTFKFFPSKANGTYSRNSSTLSSGYNKAINYQKSRSLSAKTMGRRHISTSGTWEQQYNTWGKGPNGLKPSRSDPALAPSFSAAPAPVMRAKGQAVQSQNHQTFQTRVNRQSIYSVTDGGQMTSSQSRMGRPPSSQSHADSKMGVIKTSKIEQQILASTGIQMSDLTLKEAVEFLDHPEENYQQCGTTFIQHTTFKEEQAKQEVFQLGGIPRLVTLLRSPNPAVSQAAAGALRNLVFKDHNNKLEVQHCGGIAKALQLLKETDSTETQKQITGLLWNLSSADELKGELIATALPALTENVVVPFTCWSDSSANNNIHPEVFYSATGCLRNLSCAQKKERQAMRECRGLVDSLMSYVQSCVAEDNPDDKSVENCACILHNLTYQLEAESPECFASFLPSSAEMHGSRKNSTVGCFSPKSSKAKELLFDVTRGMDSAPSGAKWLCHPKAMQTYLSLLSSSQKEGTLEACAGALQNLTANQGMGSNVMSQILVQKLGALMHIPRLLKSSNSGLQKTAMSLIGNMSRTSGLQTSMAKQILPDLANILSSGPREMGKSDDTMATALNTFRNLISPESEISKKVITSDLVSSVVELSENRLFPKGSKAASLLLYSLWNEKHLQGIVKRLGLSKEQFVNDITTAVHRSVQVIE